MTHQESPDRPARLIKACPSNSAMPTMATGQHVVPDMGAEAADRFSQLLAATRWSSTDSGSPGRREACVAAISL